MIRADYEKKDRVNANEIDAQVVLDHLMTAGIPGMVSHGPCKERGWPGRLVIIRGADPGDVDEVYIVSVQKIR